MRIFNTTARTSLLISSVVTACAGMADDGESGPGPGGVSGGDLNTDLDTSPGPWEALEGAGCDGTSNPFAVGPRCCPASTVLRKWLRQCAPFDDLSPCRDAHGAYDGALDPLNFLPPDAGTLQVCAMYVWENGEGGQQLFGPYGDLHVDFFAESEPLDASADDADRRRIGPDRDLRGPHRTTVLTDEWNDDELLRYQHAGLLPWAGRNAVVLRVYEDDGSEDGDDRDRNDVLGMERIDRASTEGGGVWVPLHRYTNDHPRLREEVVTGWILLQTGGICPH
jgi:hypothetical protein